MNRMSTKEQATFWLLKLQAENVTCNERDAFANWLTADPAHSDAYFAVELLWRGMDAVAESPEVEQGFAQARLLARAARRRRRFWAGSSLAAAAVVVAAIGLVFFLSGRVVYQTDVGELRMVTLQDGSVVTLNTNTLLYVRYRPEGRYLQLKYGQANFQVAPQPDKPFVVIAGKGAIQALGTQFDVYKAGDKITVTLMAGRVRVAPVEARDSLPEPRLTQPLREAELAPGEQISYDQEAMIALPIKKVDINRVAAWQQRRLDFYNTPLKDVVREANRYSRLKIELMSDKLREKRMTGVFEAGKSNDVVAAIQAYFDTQVTRTLDNRIVITESK